VTIGSPFVDKDYLKIPSSKRVEELLSLSRNLLITMMELLTGHLFKRTAIETGW